MIIYPVCCDPPVYQSPIYSLPDNQLMNTNILSLILAGVLAFLVLGGSGDRFSPISPSPKITPSAAMLSACAPLKSAVASADPALRARYAAAFADLAFALSSAGDSIKTTGLLSDTIQTFGDIVLAAEPDLRPVTAGSFNTALTASRDAAFASLPGAGVDKPITKSQAADFVAAIAESLK